MRKPIFTLFLIFVCMLFKLKADAQQTIAQPYYSESEIRFYNKTNPVASSPCYTLSLSEDIYTAFGNTEGINDVILYDGKLFVSVDAGNNMGGVLIYNYADVYPTRTATAPTVLKPGTSGLSTAGIAIQPSTGDLYVGTFTNGTGSDGGIFVYTNASGYAASSVTQLASYNDPSIDLFVANLAFDASGNLWFTEWHGDNLPAHNFIMCYAGVNKSNYYSIVNPVNATYASTALAGGAGPNVYLLSQPEGLAFDANGNLWVGNNNDQYACNSAGQGTFVKINAGWISGSLLNQTAGTSLAAPYAQTTIDYIPTGKLGGLLFNGNNLYLNDQGTNQGSSYTTNGDVWSYDVTTAFNTTNFVASGIHTTYPGNGLMAIDNAQFSVASDCVASSNSSEKNIITFTIPSQVGNSIIDTTAATVSVVMPYGSNLASVTPTITVSPSATVNPASGIVENFSSPVTYTVTAQDASTKTYTVTVTQQQQQITTGTAAARAAALGKGMNLSVWLENEYWFNSTTTYPDTSRFHESDIANLKSLCFTSVRLPVLFEGFASPTAPYAFTLSNTNVVSGLNYVDSVIKWCAGNNMVLVIDNHIADDNGTIDQTDYQITDANYTTQAALIAAVWKQVITRYEYANPDQVIFELRNEPNLVSDANLRVLYQTVIDTVRQYDQKHTLVVGNSGYYDPIELSQSTPYSDTNIIYTTHIYDGDGFYGFCEQGSSGEPSVDSSNGTATIAFPVAGQVAEINTEMNDVSTWSSTNHVPVWLSEFGCTTLPDVYHDDTSRCNYINTMAAAINTTGMPWACWDGYGPTDYVSGFGNPTPLYYGFSIFDRSNILTAQHLNSCFASALQVGGTCSIVNNIVEPIDNTWSITLYPNPANNNIAIEVDGTTGSVEFGVYDISGRYLYTNRQSANGTIIQRVEVSSFASGVYILEVKANGQIERKKFVVTH